ncbi:hypothetical protein PVAP13_2NG124500 [Panicum virgatum]|uniref:Uncharacterized protein n=1 Tax=Panicum virgatum TaxID=38727 RepID=A0A8T0VD53_PANVG|nr:hypothetical protein PVAP13_2NG124500 [Panicum virgatum]
MKINENSIQTLCLFFDYLGRRFSRNPGYNVKGYSPGRVARLAHGRSERIFLPLPLVPLSSPRTPVPRPPLLPRDLAAASLLALRHLYRRRAPSAPPSVGRRPSRAGTRAWSSEHHEIPRAVLAHPARYLLRREIPSRRQRPPGGAGAPPPPPPATRAPCERRARRPRRAWRLRAQAVGPRRHDCVETRAGAEVQAADASGGEQQACGRGGPSSRRKEVRRRAWRLLVQAASVRAHRLLCTSGGTRLSRTPG